MAYYAVIDGEIEDQVASNRGLSQLYDAMEAHGGDACLAFIETGRTDDVVSLASEMALIQSTPPVMTTIAGMIELMRGVDSFGISDGTEASDNREMEELDDDDSTIVENDGDSDDPDDDDLSLSGCGANGPDGGGFQKGNDCAKGGGVKKYFRGGTKASDVEGVVFLAENEDYAKEYVGKGEFQEIDIDESKLNLLDISSVRSGEHVDYDYEKALSIISDAGIDTSGITTNEGTEGHGLVKQLSKMDLGDIDAIKIHEWTLYVGETVSLAILDFKSSIGNRGTFDPDNPDITLSDCGANGPDGGGFQKGNDCAKGGGVKEGKKVSDLIEADQLISSQRFRDDDIIQQKIDDGDFEVFVSPPFEIDGESFQVVLDGHHSLSAAMKAGVDPEITVYGKTDHDTIKLLEKNDVDGFLMASHLGDDFYDVDTENDVF